MPKTNKPTDVFKYIDLRGGDTNQCWPWTGRVNEKDGRPYMRLNGKSTLAYHITYELVRGVPVGTAYLLHSCDNKICCNPHHLHPGTHQENMDEMKERERHGIPKTVLRTIKKLLEEGRTHESIAELYGLDRSTVSKIAQGRSHRSK